MISNWPVIIVLFGLSIPGICIVMPRIIYFLLPNSTKELKNRFSRFAILQSLIMALILCVAGASLSKTTGLNDPLLEALLQGTATLSLFTPILLPTVLVAFFGLIVFFVFYYLLVASIVDEKSLQIMASLRAAIGVDGCVLYGGVFEEIFARWGLMNLVTFFIMFLSEKNDNQTIWIGLISSALLFGVIQIPAYLAAGCSGTRRFIYSVLLLSFYQSIIFGYLFWHYGLIAAIAAHILFHLGWACFDPQPRKVNVK